MAKNTKSIAVTIVIAIVAITAGVWVQTTNRTADDSVEFEKLILLPVEKALQETNFIDHRGKPLTNLDLRGKWTIVFFGFTNCPDVCPTTMHALKQIKLQLEKSGAWDGFQVAMITADPARDTPERLAQYVPYFDSEFIGLTGELDSLTEFAKKLGILFIAREPDERGNYDVDHSAALILLSPEGNMAGVISAPHDVDVIARDLGKLAQLKQLSTDTTRGQQQDDIALAISDPWIRSAPPGAGSMAGYLTIENKSADDYILIGAQSPLFAEVMLHGTSIEEDIASMSALGELTLKGGTQTQFQPMGKHLMLVEPERDFKSGDLVPLRLQLKNGSNIDAVFTVKDSQESD